MPILALLLAALLVYLWWKGHAKHGLLGLWARRRVQPFSLTELEARRLLHLGVKASRADILAAHRQQIRALHPDKQAGNAELAARINAARDYLLAALPPERR